MTQADFFPPSSSTSTALVKDNPFKSVLKELLGASFEDAFSRANISLATLISRSVGFTSLALMSFFAPAKAAVDAIV